MFRDCSLVFVTPYLKEPTFGGRSQLTNIIQSDLKEIFARQYTAFFIGQGGKSELISLFKKVFLGFIDGISMLELERLVCVLDESRARFLFLNGSNLGAVARYVKLRRPKIIIFIFFHNVEARFFWGSFLSRKCVHSLGVLLANFFSERYSVKYGDKLISLSSRDSQLLLRLYGRSCDFTFPMVVEDQVVYSNHTAKKSSSSDYILFVGGAFYANVCGIKWFICHVLPRTSLSLLIVGKGFDAYRFDFRGNDRVSVIGFAEDLVQLYADARCVVAPIFDGSGMKTKVAEAIMFGRKIVGTKEAFSGYEEFLPHIGWVCRDPEDFVAAISESAECDFFLNADVRYFFLEYFSRNASRERLKNIFSQTL